MKSSGFSSAMKTIVHGFRKLAKSILKVIFVVFLVILPLGFLQIVIEQHWALGFPMIAFLAFGVYLGIRDFQSGNVDTWQGIVALVSILSITVSIFAFVSFVLYRFGAAKYQGFPTELLNEGRYISSTFFGFYTWQLFEVIPGLNVNEALGWSSPLQKSGFLAGVLVLSFRVIIIFLVLDVFRKWWVKREADSTRENNKALVKD